MEGAAQLVRHPQPFVSFRCLSHFAAVASGLPRLEENMSKEEKFCFSGLRVDRGSRDSHKWFAPCGPWLGIFSVAQQRNPPVLGGCTDMTGMRCHASAGSAHELMQVTAMLPPLPACVQPGPPQHCADTVSAALAGISRLVWSDPPLLDTASTLSEGFAKTKWI